jgi:hypothetical protein
VACAFIFSQPSLLYVLQAQPFIALGTKVFNKFFIHLVKFSKKNLAPYENF